MDIFKLIFEHDMLLENISESSNPRNKKKVPSSLEDFLKPVPTYSRFYLSGTYMKGPKFGLNRLDHFNDVINAVDKALAYQFFTTTDDKQFRLFSEAIADLNIGGATVCHNRSLDIDISEMSVNEHSGIRDRVSYLIELLKGDRLVAFKEKSIDGFDLHIFGKINIYEQLFYPLKELLSDDFKFFSINGKRAKSERLFYFETYRLDNPPHGFQEVMPKSFV